MSLQSSYDAPPPLDNHLDDNIVHASPASSSSWSVPFVGSGGGGRYQPVSPSSRSVLSTSKRFKSFRARVQDTIHEDESIDMSLLGGAAPPGGVDEPVVDLSSFSGHMMTLMTGSHDQEFLRSLQEQEASGKLTGGIGEGMSPIATIRGEQLIASSPLKRSFTRSFSMRRTPTTTASKPRASELKQLGQNEANRRGEVIEVTIPEESAVDLTTMVGPTAIGLDPTRMRHSMLPTQVNKTEVFYPQPNWKPFSMRWPYITCLILLSIGLAITQEILYQRSAEKPLIRFQNANDMGAGYYFVFKFVPTIVTVTYGVLWQNTDFEVRRLEAFYQLSKEGGALAAESINVDYITLFNFARPFLALRRRHYAVAVSSVATLLAVSLVPTLGAAALVLEPDLETRLRNPEIEKTITVNPVLSRLLTMTFFLVAVLGCVLFHQLSARHSGLLSDVKGIAGLASMAVVSHIMMDFKDMDVAKPRDIHQKLKNRRYALRNSSLVPEDSGPVVSKQLESAQQRRYNNNSNKAAHLRAENPHPLMLRAEGYVPFLIGILLFLGFIPAFLFTPASAVTDKAPWVVTALAVCLKLTWGSLETAVRMMEPYYILSRRHAPARTLALDYTALPFAAAAARALFSRHWMVFLVAWGAILVEALTIFVTSLAAVEGRDFLDIVGDAVDHGSEDEEEAGGRFLQKGLGSGSETVLSFTVTLALTVVILLYLCVVATAVFVRRRHPFLPRQPNTIASVLAFVHQSKMLYDFVGTAKLNNAQMRARLEGLGKTYGVGWYEGRDAETHCGIDEEELTGDYKHGIDYSQGNKPWLTNWELF
ncbi:hypothetical protein M426DRAFT_51381 [Hypoxylon sp. CI-4A]|nr:hypothetical protein M426DRAFT_51381 [Hypoxylon sp. CI-4A]